MNSYAEKWGFEAYSVDGDANINRVYLTRNGWSPDKADMVEIAEAETVKMKRVFESQGLNLIMHKMTQNNPVSCARSDFRESRGYDMDSRW